MNRQRRGFAMVLALALLAMTAVTIVSIGMTCTLQSARTRTLAEQAQFRQLLLAGAQVARGRLEDSTRLDGSVVLPELLAQDGYKLTLSSRQGSDSEQAIVEIQAMLDRHNSSETVHFSRQGGRWQMDSAELGL